ncbi:hypothetical protein GBAR_LOCUS23553 [Geodia barretti]|uniref:Uncharacterized protein n=1 Tax=Geodia barretti TaxID=519541 RepID=A0AA35T5Y6_GEOBA|nr:hypothetical protein GBAR_LOCUS23553 [Geodia barretti]
MNVILSSQSVNVTTTTLIASGTSTTILTTSSSVTLKPSRTPTQRSTMSSREETITSLASTMPPITLETSSSIIPLTQSESVTIDNGAELQLLS